MTVLWKQQKSVRLEDLSEREIEERNLEIWEGEVFEVVAAGKFHNELAIRILFLFDEFCRNREGVYRAGDNDGFIISRNPDTFLSPDAALYRIREEIPGPWHNFSPEVVVEILSPENTRPEMIHKRDLYLGAGTEQFWLVDANRKTIEIHFSDGRTMIASEGVVDCEGISEGMKLDLETLFEPPPFMK